MMDEYNGTKADEKLLESIRELDGESFVCCWHKERSSTMNQRLGGQRANKAALLLYGRRYHCSDRKILLPDTIHLQLFIFRISALRLVTPLVHYPYGRPALLS
jgi:hypothetical protein